MTLGSGWVKARPVRGFDGVYVSQRTRRRALADTIIDVVKDVAWGTLFFLGIMTTIIAAYATAAIIFLQ